MATAAAGGRVLSIQSHVVRGYVGNKCSVFTLQLLGFDVDPINSVQFSNHTGYPTKTGTVLQGEELTSLVAGLEANMLVRGYTHMLTGYIGSPSFLHAVLGVYRTLKEANPDMLFICDPVLGDDGRLYVPPENVDIYRQEVVPLATMLTPNHFEAELLSGIIIHSEEDAVHACTVLHSRGPDTVVITSISLGNDGEETTDEEIILIASTRRRRPPPAPASQAQRHQQQRGPSTAPPPPSPPPPPPSAAAAAAAAATGGEAEVGGGGFSTSGGFPGGAFFGGTFSGGGDSGGGGAGGGGGGVNPTHSQPISLAASNGGDAGAGGGDAGAGRGTIVGAGAGAGAEASAAGGGVDAAGGGGRGVVTASDRAAARGGGGGGGDGGGQGGAEEGGGEGGRGRTGEAETGEGFDVYRLTFQRIPQHFTGTGDLAAALLLAWTHRLPGDLAGALERVAGTMRAVLTRTHMNGSGELLLIQSKGDIEHPPLQPRAVPIDAGQ